MPAIRFLAILFMIGLVLAACGRRGALEPPPGSQATTGADITLDERPRDDDSPGLTNRTLVTPETSNPVATSSDPDAPKKRFFLDWLL